MSAALRTRRRRSSRRRGCASPMCSSSTRRSPTCRRSDFAAHLGVGVAGDARAPDDRRTTTAAVAGDLDGADDERIGAGPELVEAIRVAAGDLPPGGGQRRDTAAGEPAAPRAPAPARGHPAATAGRRRFSGKGGTGTSMVATNLAVTLARRRRSRAALVDIDLQFGDAAGDAPRRAPPPVDRRSRGSTARTSTAALLDDVLATGPAEVRVLRAPSSPELAEMITASPPARDHPSDRPKRTNSSSSTRRHTSTSACWRPSSWPTACCSSRSYNLSAVRGTKATLLLLEALGVDLRPGRRGPQPHAPARELPPRGHRGRSLAGASSSTFRTTRGSIPRLIPGRRSSWPSRGPSWPAG